MSWKTLEAVGGYGYRVTIVRRKGSPRFYLRHGSKWKTAGEDIEEARREARSWSADLLAGRDVGRKRLKLGELLRLYRRDVTPLKKPATQKEDRRRIKLWLHVLGADFDPLELTGSQLRHFERRRREGTLEVPGLALRAVRAKAIREDIAFLRSVFRWAASMEGGWLLDRDPTAGYALPKEINRRTPRAYIEHYDAIQRKAAEAHKLFPAFMQLVESLGWRVSAICQIQASDFDPTRTPKWPHGRLLKRGESDKMGVERWTVLGRDARAGLEAALRSGKQVGATWLFPAPKDSERPWTRHYATKLLRKAHELAEIPDAHWVPFHGYRRKWVDEKKHLPRADVAAQGAWLNVRTLDIYEQPDDATLLAVAEEPRKLRLGVDL